MIVCSTFNVTTNVIVIIIVMIIIVLFLFRNGHLRIVKFLVDGQHCNLEAKSDTGRTAIHYAAM